MRNSLSLLLALALLGLFCATLFAHATHSNVRDEDDADVVDFDDAASLKQLTMSNTNDAAAAGAAVDEDDDDDDDDDDEEEAALFTALLEEDVEGAHADNDEEEEEEEGELFLQEDDDADDEHDVTDMHAQTAAGDQAEEKEVAELLQNGEDEDEEEEEEEGDDDEDDEAGLEDMVEDGLEDMDEEDFAQASDAASDAELAQIRIDEGERLTVYKDTRGFLTVGVGHLVLPQDQLKLGDTITKERSEAFLRADLATAANGARAVVSNYPNLPQEAQQILVNMCFNLGRGGLAKFRRLIAALNSNPVNYQLAAASMSQSLWARQVPNRAARLIARMTALAPPPPPPPPPPTAPSSPPPSGSGNPFFDDDVDADLDMPMDEIEQE